MSDTDDDMPRFVEGRACGPELSEWLYYSDLRRYFNRKDSKTKKRLIGKIFPTELCRVILSFAFEK